MLVVLLPQGAYASGDDFPSYLFLDPYFYAFAVVNIVGIALSVSILMFIMKRILKDARGAIASSVPKWVLYLFTLTLVYQIFHQVEHISQAYQYVLLKLPKLESSGILWFLNLEWNHFIFNSGFFIGLSLTFFGITRTLQRQRHLLRNHIFLMGSTLLVQGWHVGEHVVRITRHLRFHCEPCPGILDKIFGWPLIHLHFWFNTVVLILPLTLFVWYGFYEWLILRTKHVPAEEHFHS